MRQLDLRPPILRLHGDGELVVDNFAGGGGASLGIEWALGRSPDIAVNHDAEAIAMHAANHPDTDHHCESVWKVDPVAVTGGRPIALAWFSPDCKHFSKSKGGKPRDKKIRGLAWIVTRWARAVRPRVIILENVEEFQDWGPLLDATGLPDPARKGKTFKAWRAQLVNLGYEVQTRQLRACDYGAPTSRKRFFLIARCDGLPIVWPAATHGPQTARAHRVAAECIDWSIPCPSIFDRARPLAEKTLRRIARGVWRYVIGAAEPFIVPTTHADDLRVHAIGEPLRTVTGAHRGELALVSPTLIQTSWGERKGQAPRVPGLHKPLGTAVAGGIKHAVVAAFLAKHYGGHEGAGAPLAAPAATVTATDHHALVAAHMLKLYGTCRDGQPLAEPSPTVTAGGEHLGLVAAHLMKYYRTAVGQDPGEPLHAVTSKARFAQVCAFLIKYHSEHGDGRAARGQTLDEPIRTLDTSNRFGLVMVRGEPYAIADIGMRMLTPRELARAQGFPDAYHLEAPLGGEPLSKTAQVRMIGNSVCPPIAEALVRANVARGEERRRAA